MVQVTPIPAFHDNYLWLLHDALGNAAVVDPGDAQAVEQALLARQLELRAILVTHHHQDHIGGVIELTRRRTVPVFGPDDARVPARTNTVHAHDKARVETLELELEVLEVPGHTRSHIAYFGGGALFCGDTLFAMGCGRLFEGTPEQMLDSLDRIAGLPDSTQVYCTHEYTLANACFALEVEPANAALRARYAHCLALRRAGRPTLPTTIAEERATNPFLRCSEPTIRDSIERRLGHAPRSRVECFAALRAWKDHYSAPPDLLS
jgi:hydroxyacylglutathione hydrolase